MEFTKKFLRAKSPCADGFRWFSRNVEDGTGYQDALDTLVAAGRVEDALWLLAQFGPTNAVLAVDVLEADAIVFAGTIEVRGAIDVDYDTTMWHKFACLKKYMVKVRDPWVGATEGGLGR